MEKHNLNDGRKFPMVHFWVTSRHINCYSSERIHRNDMVIYDKHELEVVNLMRDQIHELYKEEYPACQYYYELKYKVNYPKN